MTKGAFLDLKLEPGCFTGVYYEKLIVDLKQFLCTVAIKMYLFYLDKTNDII